jgi:hypothetical protein
MAKTTGPLFSLTASGTVGNTITYANWKGRPYVRRRVIPLNPMTADQAVVRNAMRVVAVATHNMKFQNHKRTPPGVVDKTDIAAITPDGQSWNGFMAASAIGTNLDNYTAAVAEWGVHAANQAAWITAAQGLDPPLVPAAQVAAFGIPATAKDEGFVLWVQCWAMYMMGLMPEPGAVPPVYA